MYASDKKPVSIVKLNMHLNAKKVVEKRTYSLIYAFFNKNFRQLHGKCLFKFLEN